MRNLIAVLRGITPAESAPITAALINAGFSRIEVTLNSPEPFTSIASMVKEFGDVAQIGAGTVVSSADVARLADIGSTLVVSPHCDPDIIIATKKAGMISVPGAISPTECLMALAAGADIVKLFPAAQIGTQGIRSVREILPPNAQLYAVGGVGKDNFGEWLAASVNGFGIGGALYRPGTTADEVARRAKEIVQQYDAALAQHAANVKQ